MPTGEVIQTYDGAHASWWRGMAFSPDGNLLASGGQDFVVKVWAVSTGRCLRSFPHDNVAGRVAWSPNGTKLASGSEDQTIKLWDVATGSCLQTFQGYSSFIWDIDNSGQYHQLVGYEIWAMLKVTERPYQCHFVLSV